MHISSRAPLLSAAASMDCIWIMARLSSLGRARQHFHHAEMLGLGQRAAFGNAQQLAVQAVLFLTSEQHGHRLGRLAAGDATFEGARAVLVNLIVRIVHHAAPWVFCFSPRIVATRAISRRTLANWWVCAAWPWAFCMRRLNCSRRSSATWSINSCADFSRISL